MSLLYILVGTFFCKILLVSLHLINYLYKMKEKLILFLLLTTVMTTAMAVPAQRGQFRTISLTDGSQVKVELIGDEFMHYWHAEDGRNFVLRNKQYVEADLESMARSAAKQRSLRNLKHQQRLTRGIGERKDYLGKKKGLIILVQFPDKKFQAAHSAEFYKRVANETGFNEDGFRGSVHDYFFDQSNGLFDLTFDVAGPYMLQNNYAYYGQNVEDENGNVDHNKNAGKMIAEAVESAAKDFDFAPYDWDGDNEVDQVFVLYAGQGEANGGDENTIWPHEWALRWATGASMSINNLKVDTYACGSELGASENITSGIGTICHEFTHCLALPDFYDTGDGSNYGMGTWDLMSAGSYNGSGFCPAGYTSYEKAWCGWLTPTELTEDATIDNLKPLSEGGGAYVIYNDNHKNEYFLLECRKKTGWDTEVGGNGLLVIHVDYVPNIWYMNTVNSFSSYTDEAGNKVKNDHMRLTIVPADNSSSSKTEAGDAYPFNFTNALSNISVPAATLYHENTDGSFYLNKSVKNIVRNADGSVSFSFQAVDTNTTKEFKGILFYESFDQCAGEGGNDGIWAIKNNGDLTTDLTGWTIPKNAGFGGNQCARFGSSVIKGSATTPLFEIGDEAELTFKAAPVSDETTRLNVSVQNSSNTTLSTSNFALTAGQWTECKSTLSGAGSLKLFFTADKNRFYIDEIRVEAKSSGSTGISTIVKRPTVSTIYNLQGYPVGTDLNSLPKGIYIVDGKKVVK